MKITYFFNDQFIRTEINEKIINNKRLLLFKLFDFDIIVNDWMSIKVENVVETICEYNCKIR